MMDDRIIMLQLSVEKDPDLSRPRSALETGVSFVVQWASFQKGTW